MSAAANPLRRVDEISGDTDVNGQKCSRTRGALYDRIELTPGGTPRYIASGLLMGVEPLLGAERDSLEKQEYAGKVERADSDFMPQGFRCKWGTSTNSVKFQVGQENVQELVTLLCFSPVDSCISFGRSRWGGQNVYFLHSGRK